VKPNERNNGINFHVYMDAWKNKVFHVYMENNLKRLILCHSRKINGFKLSLFYGKTWKDLAIFKM